jgi:hypothetical protein
VFTIKETKKERINPQTTALVHINSDMNLGSQTTCLSAARGFSVNLEVARPAFAHSNFKMETGG